MEWQQVRMVGAIFRHSCFAFDIIRPSTDSNKEDTATSLLIAAESVFS